MSVGNTALFVFVLAFCVAKKDPKRKVWFVVISHLLSSSRPGTYLSGALEIQQNSDTTYRVYDWGRVGLDGKPRSLHVQESLASIDWNHFEPEPVRGAPTSGVIADCDEFSIRRLVLGAGETVTFNANEMPRILSLVSGKVSITSGAKSGKETSQLLEPGSNGLLPYAGSFEITAESTSIVIVTEDFT